MIIPIFARQLRNKCRRYRWVYCQLDNLRRGFPVNIQSALEQLPESLDEIYKNALRRIEIPKRKYARRLFECLTVAARSLRVEELANILENPFGSVSGSNTLCDAEEAVLIACSSLITVIDAADGSRVVQFSHFSVKEFLTSDRLAEEERDLSFYRITHQQANTTFAKACLSVLLNLDDKFDSKRVEDFPLAHYASRHWFDHCRRLEVIPQDIREDTLRLFDQQKHHFSTWVRLYDMDDPSGTTTPTGCPLYYAVIGDFHWLVGNLVASQGADERGGYYETPLFAAFALENAKIALSLLQHGADANVLDSEGASVLHYASQNGDEEFVWLLLNHNADVNLRNAEGQTPLVLSSTYGHFEVCDLLVQAGANVNARDNDGRTPLWRASDCRHLEVCKLLVQADADVNARDNKGRTPLWRASECGHLDVVQYLTDNGADVNPPGSHGLSPLQPPRSQDHQDVVDLLLDCGGLRNVDKKIPPNPSPDPESRNGEHEAANFTPEPITGSLDGAANPPIGEETTSSSDMVQQPRTVREETSGINEPSAESSVSGNGQLHVVIFISCLVVFIAYRLRR